MAGMLHQAQVATTPPQASSYSSFLIALVVGLLGIAWLLRARLRRSRSSLQRISGPPGVPFFGNWFSLLNSNSRNEVIKAWVDQYGSVFKLRLFQKDILVITDPLIAQEVLSGQVPELIKDTSYCKAFAEMLPGGRSCLLTYPVCSDKWKAVRSCLAHSFSEPELHLGMAVARAKAWLVLEGLEDLGPGVVVDMCDPCSRWSLDVLGLAQLGYDFQAVETSSEVLLLKLMKECSAEWQARQVLPGRKWLWWASDGWAEGRQKFHMLQEFIGVLWRDICSQGAFHDTDHSIAAQLTRLRDHRTGHKLPEEAILPELAGLLLSGHEALGHSLTWALYLLAANPDWQQRCFSELQGTGWVQDPAAITLQGLGRLVVLDGVVREALRLYPTWGQAITRQVAQPGCALNQGQLKVPGGTLIWLHTHSLHRSQAVWKAADVFDPSRWQHRQPTQSSSHPTEQPQSSKASGSSKSGTAASAGCYDGCASSPDVSPPAIAALLSPPPAGSKTGGAGQGGSQGQMCPAEAFLPFGAGPRGCLGQTFVQVCLKTALAVLVSNIKFELSSADKSVYSAAGLALGPASGVPLLLSSRGQVL